MGVLKRSDYILLKDLPNVPKGTIFTWYDTENWIGGPYKGGRYTCEMPKNTSCNLTFTVSDVIRNKEWFKKD
jgi:hypothetical protein